MYKYLSPSQNKLNAIHVLKFNFKRKKAYWLPPVSKADYTCLESNFYYSLSLMKTINNK